MRLESDISERETVQVENVLISSPEDYVRIRQRISRALFLVQSFGSAGVIAASTINPIVAVQLSGNPALAGAPSSVYLLGSALAALIGGYLMDRLGRRWGLALGLIIGGSGAGLAFASILMSSFPAFLAGLALMGLAQAAMLLSRFAAAEIYPPKERGRAISNVVLGGAVGAILGPLLVGPAGHIAANAGLDELAGPFVVTFLLLWLAFFILAVNLKPDPRDLGREVSRIHASSAPHLGPARSLPEILRSPAVLVAVGTMVISQMVMVMLMVITSLHMKDHQHGLSQISLVISSHTFGMFAFSLVSGRLADRFGREPVMIAGACTLILACISATLSPEVIPLAISLFLLGLGWNFCFVGGSSLLADQLAPSERARTQGVNDLLIGLTSATSSLASGLVFAASSYTTIAISGAILSLGLAALVIYRRMASRSLAASR